MAETLYEYPQEVWGLERCRKEASHTARDGLGTKYPFKGYIGNSIYGKHLYNGGCIHDGKWYDGDFRPLPVVHDDFEIVRVPTWGWRIIRKNTKETQ